MKDFGNKCLQARETIPLSVLHGTVYQASKPSTVETSSLSFIACGNRGLVESHENHVCEDTETERDLHAYIEF